MTETASFDPRTIPAPVTPTDYAECYAANLKEARGELERLLPRYRALRRAGNITPRADDRGGFVCSDVNAGRVLGDILRWRSDIDHWHARLIEARQQERTDAVRAMGSSFEPGADDLAITEDEKRAFVEKWKAELDARAEVVPAPPAEPDRRLPAEKDEDTDQIPF